MKKLIFALIALCVCISAASQDKKHQIELNIGGPFNIFAAEYDVLPSYKGLQRLYEPTSYTSPGFAIGAAYSYRVAKKILVGAEFCYATRTKAEIPAPAYGAKASTTAIHSFIIMPRLRFLWFSSRQDLGLYSNVSAGICATANTGEPVSFAWQVVPVGVMAGGKHFRAFAEAGIGTCYIFRTGFQIDL